eukprot:9640005-Prorocentrum_lima.AAC.1
MTSSLVGSEMCIRDSPCTRARPPPPRSAPPRSNPPGTRRSASGREPRSAVSYTHLTLPTICSV